MNLSHRNIVIIFLCLIILGAGVFLFYNYKQQPLKQKQESSLPLITIGFYAPWEETAISSFRTNADKLTHIMPDGLTLDVSGLKIDFSTWDIETNQTNIEVIQIAKKHNVKIVPVLHNFFGVNFDPERAHKLLDSPEIIQEQFANELGDWLTQKQLNGINIDFENLYLSDYAKLPKFLNILSEVFHKRNLEVSCDIEVGLGVPYQKIANATDYVIIMGYDEHSGAGQAGPIASMSWFEKTVKNALAKFEPKKLIIGIGNYSYDWQSNATSTQPISYQNSILLAQNTKSQIQRDSASQNSFFTYTDTRNNQHSVWLLDAKTFRLQLNYAQSKNIQGTALWVIGQEDPAIWDLF